MAKKMKLPLIFKNRESKTQSWQWPSCKQPKTQSFRAGDDIFKTVNSVFFDPSDGVATPESWFTNSSETASISTASEECSAAEAMEVIIRGARSDRLFFEPGETSSMLIEAKMKENGGLPFKESVVLAMESEDPYIDFKKSMEEMVETHGLKDWECLEELLGWYLKMNGTTNHGFIVGAFVDLLIGLAASSSSSSSAAAGGDNGGDNHCSDSASYSSAASSLSSPSSPLSPLGHQLVTE